MRKQFLYLCLALVVTKTINAQVRGTRIGYIDMEYILQNVSDYSEAKTQLELKAEKWKLEIDTKKIEINKLKESLKAERALLTKELIDERETEINFLEKESLEYQQKRFGANGDLVNQKSVLIKPIQDQVFTAVQDIAERLKYDFIFDKTSDLTMLFAAKRFDISDQILRTLNRIEKREQLTKKQQKEAEARESKEDAIDENPALAERQKLLDEKKATREKVLEDRKLLQEQKKKEFDDKRKQILEDREAKKNGTVSANVKKEDTPTNLTGNNVATEEAKQKQADAKAKLLEDRKKVLEDRKKILEEKRKKILDDREAIKKAKEEKLKENTNNN
ncbi:OmpH family outer membrane protein [Flavobacterium glaciei]|uniref:Periplasmic chaperone for outer membrane proteins Skp n=1 Tax=Flavobacterium glaciei TaxID=386300 RepID=A0A562PRP7_9FLAO|nr:OmpH family outer membrane protein [Flavobacterium glaciei]RDI54818.1 periplasmic chaperone for outer membrane proteins Skp [Flavobacterium glaciei]TWI47114.1 periplasmic chaperone for outer membrane proteins Skp [Flavobacterium glaciei]